MGTHLVYVVDIALFSIGFYCLLISTNLFKRLISLSIMQTSIIILYVCIGYKGVNAVAPVYTGNEMEIYTNPLPQVLMLTAIVVGLAINAVGLALMIKINDLFESLNSNAIDKQCHYDSLYIKNDNKDKNMVQVNYDLKRNNIDINIKDNRKLEYKIKKNKKSKNNK